MMPPDATKMYGKPSIMKSHSMQISAEHQFTPNQMYQQSPGWDQHNAMASSPFIPSRGGPKLSDQAKFQQNPMAFSQGGFQMSPMTSEFYPSAPQYRPVEPQVSGDGLFPQQ